MNKLFTSEQVGIGHPDKICDQISDYILDECLKQDKYSRVGLETFAKNYNIIVGGEITSKAVIDVEKCVRQVLSDIGIDDIDKYIVTNLLDKQSPDIAMGVDVGGAGDQGIMFGYATNETKELMPLAHSIATTALIKLNSLNDKTFKKDSKSQVTINYTDENNPVIDTFLISVQHDEKATYEEITEKVTKVMKETAKEYNMNEDFKIFINPTGRFVIGGTIGDAGLTGRKIIADTYGGYARHGGGAFSGKDATKVDRSAAYMARYLAKNIVSAGLMDKCEIQLSYAIGVEEPVSIYIESFDTEKIDKNILLKYIYENIGLTPKKIIEKLDLRNNIFYNTAKYGHFGKTSLNLNFEKLDLVEDLKKLLV